MKIRLPKEFVKDGLEKAIEKRRSVREYQDSPINLLQLSSLLHYGNGLTYATSRKRAVPSAGALYPIEIYVIINKVIELSKGIYHWDVNTHSLVLVKEGDFSANVDNACLSQGFLAQSAVIFIMTSVWERIMTKYGNRGINYVYIETGHIGQNISLEAISLGLDTCPVGAFYDDELNGLIGVDGKRESAIYVISCGKAKRPKR